MNKNVGPKIQVLLSYCILAKNLKAQNAAKDDPAVRGVLNH